MGLSCDRTREITHEGRYRSRPARRVACGAHRVSPRARLPRPGRLALAVSGGYRAVLLGWARSAHGSKGQRIFGHDWQPAAGTVVDIRVKHPNSENDSRSWLMEVRCGEAEPFRVELGYPGFHEDFKGPGLGETVQVKADLKR